ncbi:MAG: T9SS type A sorting domain-containing protein [Lentimicrobium sp.]|nr:T9SS type A sorting domain-containing protein [Lentimicrobium sp.]
MSTVKSLLLAILISWAANGAFGAPVSIETARKVAGNFFSEAIRIQSGSKPNNLAFQNFICIGNQQQPIMYAFNMPGNGGFIIIAADDASPPVLCYAFTGNFNSESAGRPDGFNLFMESWETQLTEAAMLRSEQSNEIRELWNDYLSGNFNSWNSDANVEPMLSSKWDQGCWYNALCPADAGGECGHVPVGCGPTAMGQIMRYHQYPQQGTGEYGYTHPEYGYLSVNFGAATYDWSQMPDFATETNYAEIAKLLYHCGVASQTNYGPDGSGSYEVRDIIAYTEYFGYSPNTDLIFKVNYTNERWSEILRTELDHNRPVQYTGAPCDSCPGHAFVCDGYQQNDYFHFNWGWSGYYDGYFYLADLTPGSHDFTPHQKAIIGIEPDTIQHTPPLHLVANVNFYDVSLQWSPPSAQPLAEWLHYDGESVAAIQFTGTINYKVAIRFDTVQLKAYQGLKLSKIRVLVGNSEADYRLNVWKGENASCTLLDEPMTEEFTLKWTDIYGNSEFLWNNFILEDPILIDASEELWIGYTCLHSPGIKPSVAHDEGPAVAGYGDLLHFDGDYWRSMHITYPSTNYNWNIEAFVSDVYGNTFLLPARVAGIETEPYGNLIDNNIIQSEENFREPTLIGYNVFRNNEQLNSQLITQLVFTDIGVEPGTYSYTVQAVYNSGTSIPSGAATAVVEEIVLNPPLELEANAIGNDVNLSWFEPLPPLMQEWIHYDDGYNLTSIGLSGGGTFWAAVRFTPAQLIAFSGMYLSQIRLIACAPSATYQLFIAKGANASTVLCNQPLPDLQTDQWDTITLNAPILLDIYQDLWVGYKIINQPANDYAGGVDNGPAIAGYGDLISVNGTDFVSVFSLNPQLNYNWNIEALLSNYPDAKCPLFLLSSGIPQLQGFNLYRNNIKVNETPITDTSYLDEGLPGNTYEYWVKALYNAGESGQSNVVTVSIPVSAFNISDVADLKLYPVPADEFLMLECYPEYSEVRILSIPGQAVYRNKSSGSKLRIPVENLLPGVYFLEITTSNGLINTKVVIK